jgi:cholesterol oxidase
MLVHGLGVSSLIFSIDTIETNLVEYLCDGGYDVWNLDFRASILLPASRTQFSGDDIAAKDYPAAVAYIRKATQVASIQAVVHCFGSTTWFMSMLGGLEGVHSFVCSQIATHTKGRLMTTLKTGLHVPEFLDRLGIDSLNAYAGEHPGWRDRLLDIALHAYPIPFKEWCHNEVCRRIAFMYAPLYKHANINDDTHDAMHEMFGVANIQSFEHIAMIARKGVLVSATGADVYMPHLERLNLPITFIHGAENDCFAPESTQLTYELLCREFGEEKYARHVIPNYGHIDCIYGKNAAADVFPHIKSHLDRHHQ